jgi:hypothetical protein
MRRCSSLPLLFSCGHSLVDGDSIFEHDIEAGRVGTAAHEMIRVDFREDLTAELARNICAFHGVNPAECWSLVNRAREIVRELGLGEPYAVEESLTDGELTGHPDAEWIAAGAYWIGDWKSSRLDVNYFHQLMGYALLRLDRIRAMPNGCELFVAWLRDGTTERYHVTADEIAEWGAKMREELQMASTGPYVTGAHCAHCDRRTDCPAQREDMRQALAVIGDDTTLDVSKLDGATVAKVHRKLKMLAAVKERWDEALKNRIRAAGSVDCGDGFALAIVAENGKREIDTLKAWPALTERLTDEELAGCLKVGVTALQDAVAKKAPPRKGAESKRQLWADLEARGAVKQGTVDKLKEVRNQNLSEKKEIA